MTLQSTLKPGNGMQEVFVIIKAAGLTLRQDKCRIGSDKCEFLGHIAGSGRITPGESKTEAVKNFTRPKSKQDIKAWLGLTGYYRRCFPRYAQRTVNLLMH